MVPKIMSDASFTLELIQKYFLAEDVVLCGFRVRDNQPLSFIAGQHVVLKIPVAEDAHVDRAFSIFSHPKFPSLDIIVKLNTSGAASEFFREAQVGKLIQGAGPKGNFIFRLLGSPSVFIGAGAGIAPLYSMLIDLLENQDLREPIRLLFYKQNGYREIETQLERLALKHSNFRFDIIADERPCIDLIHQDDFSTHPEFYVCGGRQFIEDMRRQVTGAGFHPQSIHFEQ